MPTTDNALAQLVRSVHLNHAAAGCAQAHIERGANLVITTAPEQWAYAASLPLGIDPSEGPGLAIEARLRVLEGKVGVGILTADERSFVVERQVATHGGRSSCLVLRLPAPPVVGPLIVRNVCETGASKAVVEQVAICRLPESAGPREPFPGGASEPSPADIPKLVQSLEYLRPLVPYPGWRFDSDWNSPDFSFQTRRRLWEYCFAKRWDLAIDLPWYDGQRVELSLLGDAGRQLFVSGCIDPNEFSLLDGLLKPEMVFVDVGANIGIYTLFAARRTAAVWAVEPSSREFACLRRNLERNELAGVQAHQLALGDSDTMAEMQIASSMHSGQNTLRSFSHDGVVAEAVEAVEVRRLDRLVNENGLHRIDVLKIDVEQSELEVLKGAGEVLRSMQPWLLLEVNDASSAARKAHGVESIELLRGFGYAFYEFDRKTGVLVEASEDYEAGNLVASPPRRPLPEDVMTARKYYFEHGGAVRS